MEKLLQLAQKGPVRARDLDEADIPRIYLTRLCERGVLEKVGRGLYRLADAPATELESVIEVAARVPHATVCLISALHIHGLTTQVPNSVWIMIDRHARKPKIAYPPIEVVRASGAALTHGVEIREVSNIEVRITSRAKTVADCFRYRQHVGLDVAMEALKDYLRDRRSDINALIAAAKADRIEPFMRPYIEVLV